MNEDAIYTFAATDFGATDLADSPANALTAVRITSIPTNGQLKNGATVLSNGSLVPVAAINANLLTFVPGANGNGTPYASFTFQVQDDGGVANGGNDTDPVANQFTFNVTPVNDAPATQNATVNSSENATYTFSAADFNFSDPNDARPPSNNLNDPNSLFSVTITSLPANGTLTNAGGAVTVGSIIPAFNVNNGLLKFTPNANVNTNASFTFTVQDSGSNVAPNVNTSNTATLTISLAGVNSAPSGTDFIKTMNEDTVYTLQAADFGFSDAFDIPANDLAAVIITTTPSVGSLQLNGAGVAPGQPISATAINLGQLVFRPAANANGTPYASFTFQVQDNGSTANGGQNTDQSPNNYTFNVLSVNDEPSGANGQFQVTQGNTRTLSPSDFGFSDVNDSPANSLQAVKITFTPSAVGGDHLRNNGADVGTGQFISVADLNAGHLVYTAPASGSTATITFQVQDDGGTLNGGQDTDQSPNVLTITVNNALHGAPNGIDFTVATNEDTARVFTADDFARGHAFTDADNDNLKAVIITSLPDHGTLTDNGTAVNVGQSIPAIDITSGRLVFTPLPVNGADPVFTHIGFEIQDDGGTANGGHDTDTTPNTITVSVRPVNDAPSTPTPRSPRRKTTPMSSSRPTSRSPTATTRRPTTCWRSGSRLRRRPARWPSTASCWASAPRSSSATSPPACSRSRRPPMPTAAPTPDSPSRCRTTAAPTSAARIWIRWPTR